MITMEDLDAVPPCADAAEFEDGKVRFHSGKKFDLQLSQALIHERRLAQIFCGATFDKLELKTETHQWERTGNIAIEYESRGKPSGIAATEAHIWVHELRRDNQTLLYIMVPIARLRELCATAPRYTAGGDDRAQKGYLIKLTDLLR